MSSRQQTPNRGAKLECAVRQIGGRKVSYYVRTSATARRIRIRIGLDGMELISPADRTADQVESFLDANADWIERELDRADRLRSARMPLRNERSGILFRGERTPIVVELKAKRRGSNKVVFSGGKLVIQRGARSIMPSQTLANWLRARAREAIHRRLMTISSKIDTKEARIYIMDQRTKWGNCSTSGNLSFNWRLIMAPPFVLDYLVTHEAVHLVVPDHSKRFWLTVQSLCPATERARQWLSANAKELLIDINDIECANNAI